MIQICLLPACYRLIPDEEAAKSNYVRIVDNEGADYLYRAEYLKSFDLPYEIERALSDVP